MEPKSGVGHQYKKDEKAFHACKQSLENAIKDLEDVNNADANMLKFEMQKLANKCWHLAHSAFEAQKQDN